jgi:hypothetical protein
VILKTEGSADGDTPISVSKKRSSEFYQVGPALVTRNAEATTIAESLRLLMAPAMRLAIQTATASVQIKGFM